MAYDLAHWFVARCKLLWAGWLQRGFFGRLLTAVVILTLCALCLAIAGVLFVASFMRIFENVARGLFMFFKRKLGEARLLGKLFYLPFFLGACLLCVALIVVSIGTAFPFDRGGS